MTTGTTGQETDARDRLLSAWRREIVAAAVYELIARRLPAPEADILRRMGEAENGHRARLEARMAELAIEIPPRERVRPSLWLRLQARIAPVDRLLAAREAAENEDADNLYARPTGDPATDELFDQIRDEERGHSSAVGEIRSGSTAGPGAEAALPPARARLDTLLGGEKGHWTGGGWISGAIYGANDGLAAVFGIVAGRVRCHRRLSFVLTAGSRRRSPRRCRWRRARSWPSARRPRWLPPTSSVNVGRSPSIPRRSRKSCRSSIS